MFSFFKSSKKASPSDTPDDPPADGGGGGASQQSNPEDFVLIGGNRPQSSNDSYPPNGFGSSGMYPSLGGHIGGLYGGGGGYGGDRTSGTPQQVRRQDSSVNFHYLQGVPFKLANEISTGGDSTEIERIQVDAMLASLTRTLDFSSDYEFKLEQEVAAR